MNHARIKVVKIPYFLDCGPGDQDIFLTWSCNIKYQNVKFKFTFWRKIGVYHKETANNIVQLHVLCPTDEIVLF